MVDGGAEGVDDISFPRESEEGEGEREREREEERERERERGGEVLKESEGDDRGGSAGEDVDESEDTMRGEHENENMSGGKGGLEGSIDQDSRQVSGSSCMERAKDHEVKALKWYRKAAKLGHPWGIVMTSECYSR